MRTLSARLSRPAKHIVEKLSRISVASACGVLWKVGFNNTYMLEIKSYVPGRKVVGPAITVRYIPIREDLLERMPSQRSEWADFYALEMVREGDVVVCDVTGHGGASAFGDVMLSRLQTRGGVGLVVDGEIRDLPILKTMGVPVFAKGVHGAPGPRAILPVDLNVPIQCGGVAVMPGDIIVADDDGVVVVPRKAIGQVAKLALEEETLEHFVVEKLLRENIPIGEYYPPTDKTKRAFEKSKRKIK